MIPLAGRGNGLYRLADLASEFAAERVALTTRLIAERVFEGRFYVACVGQFKRGKSTLLNALVGQAILPSGVIPVTSIPTILRYGAVPAARLRLSDANWKSIPPNKIEEYVSENKNPENVKGVTALEIFVPCSLLETGMCLVDTPGLGSVFSGNTKATKDFIPQMDAALIVVGVDPPISGEELNLVEKVAHEVPEILFVLNKADRSNEQDCSIAVKFARQVLETRLTRTISEIYKVSALERLECRGPDRDWPKLVLALERLMQQSGPILVRDAAQRAARSSSAYLLAAIEEERLALQEPLENSDFRIKKLHLTLEKADETMHDIGALLGTEQRHFSHILGDRRRMFLDRARITASDKLRVCFSSIPKRQNGPAYRREIMHLAQEIASRELLPWLESEQRYAEAEFHKTMERFVEVGCDFLCRLSEIKSQDDGFFSQAIHLDPSLQSKSQFHLHLIERVAAPASPLVFIADIVRGILGLCEGIRRDALEFLDQLLEVNSFRVQNDVEERVRESRKNLETEIKAVLREVLDVTERALTRARSAHVSGVAAVQTSIARLDSIEREIRLIVRTYAKSKNSL